MVTIRSQISTTVYSPVLMHIAERTGALWIEKTCSKFDTAAQDSNPGSLGIYLGRECLSEKLKWSSIE